MPVKPLQTKKRPGRWRKGESGNPSGRRQGSINLTSRLKRALAKNPALVDQIIERWIEEVIAGKFQYFQELLNRIDGKVPDKVELPDGVVFKVTIPQPRESLTDESAA